MTNLTPTDIRNVIFKKPAFGKRGYDEAEVDAFLDRVEHTIAAMMAEISALRRGSGYSPPPDPSPAPLGDVPAEIEQIKMRLARLEAKVSINDLRPRSHDPLFGPGV